MSLSPVLLLALLIGNPAWVQKASVPEPRIFEIAATINGRIFAVTSGEDGKPGTEVFVYDPAANTWTRRAGHANLVRHSFGAAALDGKIYIWGGVADRRLTGSAEVYDPAADCWTSIAPLPRPRMFAKGAAVNGKLYAVGGIVPPGRNQAPFIDEFDPKTNRWTTKADMPVKRDAYRVAAAGDKIYVVGNLNGGAEALEYDPAADRWAVKAPMPTPRFDFGVLESGGRIYTFGGMGTNALEVYDPPTNTWIRKPPMPRNNWEQVAAEAGGKIYVIGGGFPAGSVLDLVYEYDPGVEQAADWAPRAAMPRASPFPHQWPAVIGGRIYAILDGEGSVLEFDPDRNMWTDRHAPMPTKRHHYATVVAGGKLYVLGGCTGGEGGKHERIAAVEEYDPSTNTWRARKPMPTPRMGLGAAALGGLIYAIGGVNEPAAVSAVEVYDPAADAWTARRNWRRRDIHCWGAVEIAGKIYVAGSGRENGHVLDVYDPPGDTFTAKTSRPRNVPAYAVAASGGRMYAFGGQRRGGYVSAVDVYDPAADAWAPAGDLPRAKGYAGAAVVDGNIYVMGGVLGKWQEQDASVAEFVPAARIQGRQMGNEGRRR